MAQFVNMRKVDLMNGEPAVFSLRQLYYADENANRIGAIVQMNGEPFPLTGTCSGTAIRADGATVPMTGTVEDNQAYIILNADCYAVEGDIQIFVKLTTGDVTATLVAARGTVRLTETGAVIDPGEIIPSVSALITAINDAVASIPADYSDLLAAIAPDYTDLTFPVTAGTWCWHDGGLYRAAVDIPAAETWTEAHWKTAPLGNALAGDIADLKSAIDSTAVTANAAYFNLGLVQAYTFDNADTYKNAFIDFPLEVGKEYTFANKSTGINVFIASTDINAEGPSQDTEVLVQQVNAGKTATATPTQSAKYLRIYFSTKPTAETPAIIEIAQVETMIGGINEELSEDTNTIKKELSESGDLDLTHLSGMTMSTTGTIYASSGNAVAYAKVYKGTQVTFFADNNGVFEAASCRYGYFDTIPAGGKTADSYGSGYTATAQKDCYIAFTRPGKSLFQATYINTQSVIYNTNRLVQDVYSDAGTLETERVADTAINTSNGYWFSATGWTAGTAAVRGGASLVFLADGVSTNCRWTLCRGSLAYGNIHSFGVGYGVFVPNDADYTIIISAPADVTAFTLQYTAEGIKEKVNGYWYGKKIVWFGTSIPAGVINAGASGGIGSYPERIGNMLGARVYNEAVGSSRARAGSHALATEDDPLGFAGMSPIGILLSLSISSAEKQDFIDNWDSKWKNIIADPSGTMSNLTPALITTYKNSSWDIKLAKYLSGGSVGQCDLYVFDHGFNDAVNPGQFDDMSDVPPSDDPTNRSYWLGAMAFLFKKILYDNYKAKILIIGHYMNAPTQGTTGAYLIKNGVDKCCAAQEKLASLWGIPIVKTWEYMRISNNIITKNGENIPELFAYFPDGIHPASDTSGYALQYYADVLEPHIANIH